MHTHIPVCGFLKALGASHKTQTTECESRHVPSPPVGIWPPGCMLGPPARRSEPMLQTDLTSSSNALAGFLIRSAPWNSRRVGLAAGGTFMNWNIIFTKTHSLYSPEKCQTHIDTNADVRRSLSKEQVILWTPSTRKCNTQLTSKVCFLYFIYSHFRRTRKTESFNIYTQTYLFMNK